MEENENKDKASSSLKTKKNVFFTHTPLKNKFLAIKRFKVETQESKINIETNHGYWTKSEHDKFIEALYLYNCDWMKIISHLKNRTLIQIYFHAQKFFLLILKIHIYIYN